MGKQTGIAWTDHTHNWWWGCNEVTPEECGLGLEFGCYARDRARQYGWKPNGKAGPELWGSPRTTTRRIFGDKHNAEPYLWNADCMRRNERECAFAESFSDLFEFHPLLDQPRQVAFRTVKNTPFLDWKMLTKRPQLIAKYVPLEWLEGGWPSNAWIGFSAGNQTYFDQRWQTVIDLPAPVIFVSHEPATGPIDIDKLAAAVGPERLWIITGGMSGPNWKKWPMDLDWARYMRDQCIELGVPFFYKQASAARPGKLPVLDGRAWHQWPDTHLGPVGGVRAMPGAELI